MNEVKDTTRVSSRWSIDEHVAWVILNCFICAVPIIATFAFSDETVGFSSLLSYCFTVVAVNACFFMHCVIAGVDEIRGQKSLITLATLFTVAAIAIFFTYNLTDNFKNLVNSNIVVAIILTALIYLSFAWVLAKPMISRQAHEAEETAGIHKAMKRKKKTEAWAAETSREIDEKGI